MKFNFKWNKNKQEMTPEMTEQSVNVYTHPNMIKGVEHLGEKQCKVCGKWFAPRTVRQVICSKECRMEQDRRYQHKHYFELKEKRGKEEGKMYGEPKKFSNGRTWYPPIKTCPNCGKSFVATNNKQMYCCTECREKAAQSYTTVVKKKPAKVASIKKCMICGKEFTGKRDDAKYCSDECRAEAARRISRAWWREKGAKKRGYDEVTPRPDFWHTQASVIVKLVKSGVDEDIVAKYLKTIFGDK